MQKQIKHEKRRSTNFSTNETNLLVKLVHDKKDILDCSKLDSVTLDKKNEAWHDITSTFNSKSEASIYRDEKALKKKYSNLKSTIKDWTHLLNPIPIDLPELESLEVCDVVSNISEDDNIKQKSEDTDLKLTSSEMQIEQPQQNEFCERDNLSEDETIDDDTNYEKLFQTTNYERNRHNSLDKSKIKWSEEKAKLEMEILETEHKERMQMMKRKHEIEMEKLELQKTKHKLEIELLNVELAYKKKSFHNKIM